MVLSLLLALSGSLVLQAPADTAAGAVYGRVLSAESLTPVPGARVEIRGSGEHRIVLTDRFGRYRFGDLAAGGWDVSAHALDHAPLSARVSVPAGATVPLELKLELRPVRLPSLLVLSAAARDLAEAGRAARSPLGRLARTTMGALEAGPGALGLGDIGDDEGAPGPGERSSPLYVRGAATDLKLVLLDDAPVYAPFHLSGLIEPFPTHLLSGATLYAGGAPPRYDGGISYVLDMSLRGGDPEQLHGGVHADLLAGGGWLEGPVGDRAQVLVSGRGLHGAAYGALTSGDRLPYGYGDLLARADVELGSGTLHATGFWNRESVDLSSDPGEVADVPGSDLGPLPVPDDAYWGNTAGSLRWEGAAPGGSFAVSAAYGLFESQIPIQTDDIETVAAGQTRRARLDARYQRRGTSVRWALGTALDRHGFEVQEATFSGDSTRFGRGTGWVGAIYAETAWEPDPEIELSGGIRAQMFSPTDQVRLGPRAAVTWRLGEAASLRLSGGRFHQFLRGPESILSSDLTGPTLGSFSEPTPEGPSLFDEQDALTVASATHLVLGFSQELDTSVRIGLEGFFKRFDGLPAADGLRSSGADLWVYKEEGPVRGWLGYQLGWVWTEDEEPDQREFVGRQLLTAGVESNAGGIDLAVRLTYGAGLPFTQVTVVQPNSPDGESAIPLGPGEEPQPPPRPEPEPEPAPALSGAPDDSYLRLDARISRTLHARMGGREVTIEPYLRLLNALDRRDALFYRADQDSPGSREPIASVPVLPILGLAWTF